MLRMDSEVQEKVTAAAEQKPYSQFFPDNIPTFHKQKQKSYI